jgi:immunoglobulin heavy chain
VVCICIFQCYHHCQTAPPLSDLLWSLTTPRCPPRDWYIADRHANRALNLQLSKRRPALDSQLTPFSVPHWTEMTHHEVGAELGFPCRYSKKWFVVKKRYWVCEWTWLRGELVICGSYLTIVICVCRHPLWGAADVVWRRLGASGGSLIFYFAASGFIFSDYYEDYLHQASGKGLKCGASIWNKGNSYTAEHNALVKRRFTISRDNDKNMLYLQITSLRAEDTAMYYYTRDTLKVFNVSSHINPLQWHSWPAGSAQYTWRSGSASRAVLTWVKCCSVYLGR